MVQFVTKTIEPEDNFGVGVSTIWAKDIKCYETALIDKNGVYPVQRYDTKEEALLGHWHWITESRKVESIIQLGCHLYDVPDIVINLTRTVTMQ